MSPTGNSGTNEQDLKNLAAMAEASAKVDLNKVIPGLETVLAGLTKAKVGLAAEIKNSIEATESQVNSVSRLFGGSHLLAQQTRDIYRDATPSIALLGGQIGDVAKIQKGVLEGLQTQATLNTSSYKELYAAGSLVAGSSENASAKAAAMIPMFTNAGYGINNIGKEMAGILNSAKDLGVTSQSVYKQLEGQMGKMALYNFDGGVQGMAKMAAQAALLRIDMSQSLTLADKLFEPDAAVQMSAAFQRLGVQVSSLLDPYKLMDMSRNDPEKLQEEVGKALKSMTYFDEKTKSIRILPGAQGQLREIAKEMNMSADQVAKWAINAGDLDRKMREITFNPDFADENSRKMIAGMAQLQTEGDLKGQYTVTLASGQEKIVSEVNREDLKEIQDMNKKLESPAKMQLEANGILKNIEGLIAARKGIIGQVVASDAGYVKDLQDLSKYIYKGQETINRTIGLQREVNDKNQINVESISKNINILTAVFSSSFGKLTKGDTSGAFDDLATGGKVAYEKMKKAIASMPQTYAETEEMFGGTQNVNSSTMQNATPSSKTVPGSSIGPGQLPSSSITNPSSTISPEAGNIKVDGSISVNVNPIGLEGFIMDMLAGTDLSNAVYNSTIQTQTTINDLKGSGENKAKAGNLFSPTSAIKK